MTRTTRRHFLQFTGSALAAIGLNQLSFLQSAQRYGKVLAQSTPRKLALIVGINNYPLNSLEGCLNDVDLQRNLLIYRFGFNPKDILVLPDTKATRQGILTAFEEHLIKQARLRRMAEEAMQKVQKNAGSDQAVKQLREELDQLKKDNQELKSRLENLEAKAK